MRNLRVIKGTAVLFIPAMMAFPAWLRSETAFGDLEGAILHGAQWLQGQQNPDGGFGPLKSPRLEGASDVGITAFALYALSSAGKSEGDDPAVKKAAEFLISKQQADGGFFDPRDPSLENYKTCVSVLALLTLDRVKYAPQISKAQSLIKSLQFSEDRGVSKDDLNYGAIGYGSNPSQGDASNSQMAVEALHESGLSGADSVYKRVVVFLSRCQNAPEVDPALKKAKVGTTKDGGFRYGPHFTRGREETLDDGTRIFSSYGSMTYAGLKSFLYANVEKSDPRVQAAFAWISRNFSVKENPGMASPKDPLTGQEGLFYYYYTMAKALRAYGEPLIADAAGAKHDWARELGEQLAKIQKPDGSWANTSKRWMEEIPVLATSYAVTALTNCKKELEKRGEKK